MPLNEKQLEELNKPLRGSVVSKREQSGRQLSYIEGYHAINEANRIFGYDSWNLETLENVHVTTQDVTIGQQKKEGVEIGYRATVRVTVGDIVRTQTGFGSGRSSNPKDAHELACKEAETDAMKRALRSFGSQFGNALYDKEQKDVVDDTDDAEESTNKTTTAKSKKAKKEVKSNKKTTVKGVDFFKMIDSLETEEEFINFKKEYRDKIKEQDNSAEVVAYFNKAKNQL